MSQKPYNFTSKKFLSLTVVFIFALMAQAFINYITLSKINALDANMKNERVKNQIGKEIVDKIDSIESNFFKLATMSNKTSRDIFVSYNRPVFLAH